VPTGDAITSSGDMVSQRQSDVVGAVGDVAYEPPAIHSVLRRQGRREPDGGGVASLPAALGVGTEWANEALNRPLAEARACPLDPALV
jgi:hypothetical protein